MYAGEFLYFYHNPPLSESLAVKNAVLSSSVKMFIAFAICCLSSTSSLIQFSRSSALSSMVVVLSSSGEHLKYYLAAISCTSLFMEYGPLEV